MGIAVSPHNALSLLLMPTHTFPLLHYGVPAVASAPYELLQCGSFHKLQFLENCSRVGPFQGVQSFRNGLLKCGVPTGHRKPAPVWTPLQRPQFLPGLCSPEAEASSGPHQPAAAWGLQRLQCDSCSTMVLTGCRESQALGSGASPSPFW